MAHANSRPSRTKLFGSGRPRPLDREAKVRVMHRARALMRRTAKGKAYGVLFRRDRRGARNNGSTSPTR